MQRHPSSPAQLSALQLHAHGEVQRITVARDAPVRLSITRMVHMDAYRIDTRAADKDGTSMFVALYSIW